ncbi:hypothetical protein PIB30_035367 [Stylosanthes scabra]|uniref:Uncharacterized protein n=1 Tax=Stylosanthes scabra TaxID=79078 RepID=A0ABU6XB38_9FABA|nr:hypothetical protein [Stylosanthes scabra]
MESDRAASSHRRSGGGGRSERSSSTQGVCVPREGQEREGVAPKCHCGVYTIPYLSKTEMNPNREIAPLQVLYVADLFTARIANDSSGKAAIEEVDVREQFSRNELENRMHDLENRVAVLEKKKYINLYYVIAMFVVVV